MIKPPEIMETSRLLLRLPVLEDADGIFQKYAQDPEVTRYLVWQPHKNIDVTREFVHRCIQCWQDGTAFPWIVVRKNDDELAGIFRRFIIHPNISDDSRDRFCYSLVK